MAVPEVNKKLLTELEEMGFPLARATRALHYSGNTDLEAAINWVVDHEDDPDIDEMPLVLVNIDIEASQSSITEQVKLKAQELRDQARRRREEEAKKQEREREKERIRAGKELQEAKQIAEENERKRALAMQKVEKEKEKRDREKIRQKIQQDKLERRQWLGLPVEGPESVKATRPAMQEKMNLLTVKSATLPVKSATKAELMRDCLRSLRRNHKDNDAKVKRAFHTLLVYVRNVAWNPNEEKFRKIRVSNPAFQDRVGAFEEGVKFLELCGFERVEGGNFLYLPRDKVNDPPVRNSQEAFMMEMRAARMVQAADSLLKLVSELKQTAIFSGFASLNDHVEQRTEELNQQAEKTDRMLSRIGEEAASSLKDLESHYYSSSIRTTTQSPLQP